MEVPYNEKTKHAYEVLAMLMKKYLSKEDKHEWTITKWRVCKCQTRQDRKGVKRNKKKTSWM